MTSNPEPVTTNSRICRNCGLPFTPNPHNRHRQQFCFRPECRRASKAASQHLWLAKNPEHFHGSENVLRVQEWRHAHPGYARRSQSKRNRRLEPNVSGPPPASDALQDFVPPLQDFVCHNPLIVGLIAHIFGCALQEDVDMNVRWLINRGNEILGVVPGPRKHDDQESPSA